MRFLLTLPALALLATPAFAEEKKADDSGKMICKYQAKSGTRFKTKTCRTKAHWDEVSENARRQAAEDFNKPTISTERGN